MPHSLGKMPRLYRARKSPKLLKSSMFRYFLLTIVVVLVIVLSCTSQLSKSQPPMAQQKVSYSRDIFPILRLRCSGCHGPHVWWSNQYQRGLDVTTYKSLMKGGKQGPAIIPGHPERSLLVEYLESEGVSAGKRSTMPFVGKPLPKNQIELIKRWIKEGAVEDHVVLPKMTIHLPDVQITRGRSKDDVQETIVCHIPVEAYATIIISDPSGKELTRTGGAIEKLSGDQEQDLGTAGTAERGLHWPLSRSRNNDAPRVELPDIVSVDLVIEQNRGELWGTAFTVERENYTGNRTEIPRKSSFVENPISIRKHRSGVFIYELEADADVKVEIVKLANQKGNAVYQDSKTDVEAGWKLYPWRLRDNKGQQVPSGGYLARFRCKARNRNKPVKDVCIALKVDP